MDDQIELLRCSEADTQELIEMIAIYKDPVPRSGTPLHKGSFPIPWVIVPSTKIRKRLS
jgi:hypothetical protein